MIPKKPAPDLIRGGNLFSDKITPKIKMLAEQADSIRTDQTLESLRRLFTIAVDSDRFRRQSNPGARSGCRVLAGDKVLIEMTSYDLTKGRITYRFK